MTETANTPFNAQEVLLKAYDAGDITAESAKAKFKDLTDQLVALARVAGPLNDGKYPLVLTKYVSGGDIRVAHGYLEVDGDYQGSNA